ncbi:MAG TPA: response regulator transcription factor [Spirochaetota bacterium]|jgi:DNA-binding NarL/FixJ family response regulator|nr:response regulator transcription factor [Spirochaetota bacterium]OPZ35218.1 MAG: Response regulator UvrY [Spirochaetes bacterium ADurb.BinA120]HNU92834.1 response regulator transcription factor [Spirochaetota bacterium]HPI14584.1 response regulator transcription factor [Spirochaetota bacterium]HPO46065.1 response regulator transcription factor [Spirochaetota bacterium]
MKGTVSIIIADDHPVVRAGLRQILAESGEIRQIAEASDGQDLLEKLKKTRYDIILLDITMPGRNGLEILKELRILYPSTPVLVLSVHPEEQYALRVIRSGAAGYLTKETAPENLLEAIRRILGGKKYITPEIAEILAASLDGKGDLAPHLRLSDREFETLRMIAQGKSLTEIAGEMFLNVKTISTYRRRILDKMNMKSTAELVNYAVKNGLVG